MTFRRVRSELGAGSLALSLLAASALAPHVARAQSDAAGPGAPRPARRRPASPPAEERVATVRGSVVRDRTASEYLVPAARFDVVPRANAGDVVALAPGAGVS